MLYESKISTRHWMVYDILGNAGWIIYFVCLGLLLKRDMADDGRLRRVGSHIDVRSICHYIENDHEMNFRARYRKRYPALRDDATMADGEFFAASRGKRRH